MVYANGRVPAKKLVKDGEHYFFPGTYRRWCGFRQDVFDETGVWLVITPGPNAYRSLTDQQRMRRELGTQAAVPGTSSHGGRWTGTTKGHSGVPTWVQDVESGALDVYNWAAIPWEIFTRLARKWGLIPDIVVPTEKWHLVDLDPWGHNLEEDDMPLNDDDKKWLKKEIAKSVWTYKSAVNGVLFGDMLRVTFNAIRYGVKGRWHHGTVTAAIMSEIGAQQSFRRKQGGKAEFDVEELASELAPLLTTADADRLAAAILRKQGEALTNAAEG